MKTIDLETYFQNCEADLRGGLILAEQISGKIEETEECFDSSAFWLLWGDGFNLKDIVPHLRLDSNVFTVSVYDKGGGCEITEHYSIKNTIWRSSSYAIWNPEKGLQIRAQSSIWERRQNLFGIELAVGTMTFNPFVVPASTLGIYSGLIPDIVAGLSEMANFTTKWQMPEDEKYGGPLVNGSWSGLIGMIQKRQADLIAAALSITSERVEVVNFVNLYITDDKSTLTIQHPNYYGKPNAINIASFLGVFTPAGWLFILVTTMSLTACHFGLFFLNREEEHVGNLEEGFLISLAFAYKSALGLGSQYNPRMPSSKLILLTAYLTFQLIFMFYEGMLTSFMTTSVASTKITSFLDAVSQGYQVVAISGTKDVYQHKNAPLGSGRRKVHDLMLRHQSHLYNGIESVRKALLNDPMKAVTGSCFLFWKDERFLCLRDMVDATTDHAGLAVPQNSEYEGLFRHCMLKLARGGYNNFLDNKWLYSRRPFGTFSNNNIEEAKTLGYSTLLLPLVIVGSGIIAAPVLTLGEIIVSRCSTMRVKHSTFKESSPNTPLAILGGRSPMSTSGDRTCQIKS